MRDRRDARDVYNRIIYDKGAAILMMLEGWLGELLKLDGQYSHRSFEEGRVVLSDLGYDLWIPRGQADKVLRLLAQSGANLADFKRENSWETTQGKFLAALKRLEAESVC